MASCAGSAPAHVSCHGVCKNLPRLHPCPAIGNDWLSSMVDGFVETTSRLVRADIPPDRQSIVHQPLQQTPPEEAEIAFDVSHDPSICGTLPLSRADYARYRS
jgi:hypothetical protein